MVTKEFSNQPKKEWRGQPREGIARCNFEDRIKMSDIVFLRSWTQILASYSPVCIFRGCLVYVFKQQLSVFKQHFTHFNALFHPHVFPQIFLNNNFQFLNTHTKRALSLGNISSKGLHM